MGNLTLENIDNPGSDFRGAPFWSWNTKLDEKTLKKQIKIFKEMGFGGFHMHSRVGLDTEYMGEKFMDAVALCVNEAKRLGIKACIYDEDRWPSGYGGGQVTKKPEYRAVHLLFTTVPYGKDVDKKQSKYNPNFAAGVRTEEGRLYAVYDIVLDEEGYLLDCHMTEEEELARGTKWYAYIEENPPHTWYNGGTYVDVLNKAAIDEFINCIYEKYKDKVGAEFGSTVPSIFTDEPHMIYRTNMKGPFSKEDLYQPWTCSLPEVMRERYCIDIRESLPELFWEKKDNSGAECRYYFARTLSDLFAEAYAANIGKWCRGNGIAMTGHYLFEETLFMQNRSDGDLMRMYRHMDLPGMDLLFNEVALTTAAQIHSIVRQYGKTGAASELYGGTDWDFDFRGHIFQGSWQSALGVTFRVPHLSYMSMKGEAKRDFPASIFYQSPWYEEYHLVEDYFARLNVLLTQGRPVAHIGVIHPIESYWMIFGTESQTGYARKAMDDRFVNLNRLLLTSGLDFDYIDEELIPELYKDGKFGYMSYKVIIIPDLLTVRSTTLKMLSEFAEEGGKILILGDVPQYIDAKPVYGTEYVQECIISKAERIAFEEEDILEVLRPIRDFTLENADGSICTDYVYQLRRCDNACILFFAPAVEPEDKDFPGNKNLRLRFNGEFCPVRLDLFSGDESRLEYLHENGHTLISLGVSTDEAVMLLLRDCDKSQDSVKQKGGRLEEADSCNNTVAVIGRDDWKLKKLAAMVDFKREEPNVLLLDTAQYSLDGGAYMEEMEILRIDEILRDKFGMTQRNMDMTQPYTRSKSIPRHTLGLKYRIESSMAGTDVWLAAEDASSVEIFWNGNKASADDAGWYVDEHFRKRYLGKTANGMNSLKISMPYGEDTNLEAVYLLGDFGVKVQGREAQIVPSAGKLPMGGDITAQGLPFYGGNVVYKFEVDCPEGRLRIDTPKYRGAFIGIKIDGERVGELILSSDSFETHCIAPGIHLVEMILYGNRYNTFGALHSACDSRRNEVRPSCWRERGKMWCDEYNLRPIGILTAPRVYV